MPDRVKEAIFNLLRGHCEDGPVLDAFAGTGSIGLEAISRGAPRCVFIEKDRAIGRILRRNIDDLEMGDRAELVQQDVLGPGAIHRCPDPCHLMFFDPPYPLVRDREGWDRVRAQVARFMERLDDTGFVVLRTPWPFLHVVQGASAESQPPEETITLDLDDPESEAKLEAWEAAFYAQSRTSYEDVDLSIEGAIGPETHDYRHTAVHLYMRDRS